MLLYYIICYYSVLYYHITLHYIVLNHIITAVARLDWGEGLRRRSSAAARRGAAGVTFGPRCAIRGNS